MRKGAVFCILKAALTVFLLASTEVAWSQHWTSFENNTRYLALGDSLSAGYGAHPSTNGFVYQLYQSGAIDNINNTLQAVPFTHEAGKS